MPTAIAAVVALMGLLLLSAAELLTAEAFHDELLTLLNRMPTWYEMVLDNREALVRHATHPLGVMLYFLPVASVAVWCRVRAVQWFLCALVTAMGTLDVHALLDTLKHPNIDQKGCEACMGLVLVRLFSVPIWLLLLIIGAWMLVSYSPEEAKK